MEDTKPFDAVYYADLDDELLMLFDGVRKLKKKRVAVVLPKGSHILLSLVTLKILRHKCVEEGIHVVLVTADTAGRQVAQSAGFATAERLTDGNTQLEEYLEAPKEHLTELRRRRLDLVASPEDSDDEPLPIDDIPLARLPRTGIFKKVWLKLVGGIEEDPLPETSTVRYAVRRPSVTLLFLLFVTAGSLLFFVIYIAVPTATVYISPRADPITQTVSVELTNTPATNSTLPQVRAEFVDTTITREVRIGATGRNFEGTNATGQVTLYNRTGLEKYLVKSRLQSKDGLIFYTTAPVTIPPAVGETPGSIDVNVVACQKDDASCDCINSADTCKGEFVGERGNIQPNFFVFPAIPSISPSRYWGESKLAFSGGTTKVTTFVTQDDVDKVKETITRDGGGIAEEELKGELVTRNLGAGWEILHGKNTLVVEVKSVSVPPNLVGSVQDAFVATATLRIRGVLFDQESLRSMLASKLATKVHPEKRLQAPPDFDNATVQIEDLDLDKRSVRLAVGVSGVEAYDLSEETDAGSRLTNKIRGNILGTPVADAEKFIGNLPEVNSVSIASWPFWAQVIPELPENVRFKVK